MRVCTYMCKHTCTSAHTHAAGPATSRSSAPSPPASGTLPGSGIAAKEGTANKKDSSRIFLKAEKAPPSPSYKPSPSPPRPGPTLTTVFGAGPDSSVGGGGGGAGGDGAGTAAAAAAAVDAAGSTAAGTATAGGSSARKGAAVAATSDAAPSQAGSKNRGTAASTCNDTATTAAIPLATTLSQTNTDLISGPQTPGEELTKLEAGRHSPASLAVMASVLSHQPRTGPKQQVRGLEKGLPHPRKRQQARKIPGHLLVVLVVSSFVLGAQNGDSPLTPDHSTWAMSCCHHAHMSCCHHAHHLSSGTLLKLLL